MWKLYDRLISGIPDDIKLEKLVIGAYRTAVYAGGNLGLATTVIGNCRPPSGRIFSKGDSLKELACLVKSWNFTEASLGLAAINAYYNKLDLISSLGKTCDSADTFSFYENEILDKKVAVIGHFKDVEAKFQNAKSLIIIERDPKYGDYPDSACEYLLAEQDFVFITGMTLQNKTLPRLLELSKNSRIILAGPSLPFSSAFKDFNVETLSGFCVTNPEEVFLAVKNGSNKGFYKWGEKLVKNLLL